MLTIALLAVIVLLLSIVIYLYRKRSNLSYDGNVIITRYPDGKTLFSLELDDNPENIRAKGILVFKVVQEAIDVSE